MPKELEGYRSGTEGNITHTYGYGMLCLKEGPNQLWHIFSTLYITLIQFFH